MELNFTECRASTICRGQTELLSRSLLKLDVFETAPKICNCWQRNAKKNAYGKLEKAIKKSPRALCNYLHRGSFFSEAWTACCTRALKANSVTIVSMTPLNEIYCGVFAWPTKRTSETVCLNFYRVWLFMDVLYSGMCRVNFENFHLEI